MVWNSYSLKHWENVHTWWPSSRICFWKHLRVTVVWGWSLVWICSLILMFSLLWLWDQKPVIRRSRNNKQNNIKAGSRASEILINVKSLKLNSVLPSNWRLHQECWGVRFFICSPDGMMSSSRGSVPMFVQQLTLAHYEIRNKFVHTKK